MQLVRELRDEGWGCRDERDYVLVALLLMKSLVAVDAAADLGIWGGGFGSVCGGVGAGGRAAGSGFSLAMMRLS
jgi:hypothetical protein